MSFQISNMHHDRDRHQCLPPMTVLVHIGSVNHEVTSKISLILIATTLMNDWICSFFDSPNRADLDKREDAISLKEES